MFGNFSKFQIAVYGIILTAVVAAFFAFSFLKRSNTDMVVELTMWGPFKKNALLEPLGKFNLANRNAYELKYTAIESAYEEKFINNLASGAAPDFLVITQDLLLKHRGKFYPISFERLSERSFKDSFADESELFLTENGAVAVPFLMDPVILYWNKDLFSKAGLAGPPKLWDEFPDHVKKLTEIDRAGNIIRSGAALGEFSNVRNAKEILSFLILQAGNPIVDSKTTALQFGAAGTVNSTDPVSGALRFFTEFSNPSKLFYSWNRGLPDSREMFISGNLAMYFGYASEFDDIRDGNPHLNFDVTTVPQIKDSPIQATFGRVYALAIPKASKNAVSGLDAVFKFAVAPEIVDLLVESLRLPPASRALLAKGNLDPQMSVFYKAAVQSRGWLEPDANFVNGVFKDMVESVSSGRKGIQDAIMAAAKLLNKELDRVEGKN